MSAQPDPVSKPALLVDSMVFIDEYISKTQEDKISEGQKLDLVPEETKEQVGAALEHTIFIEKSKSPSPQKVKPADEVKEEAIQVQPISQALYDAKAPQTQEASLPI